LAARLTLPHSTWTKSTGGSTRQSLDCQYGYWADAYGKGSKPGKVALPPLARSALNRYLSQRGLPTTPLLWKPDTPMIGDLRHGQTSGITDTRLRELLGRFFKQAAALVEADNLGIPFHRDRTFRHRDQGFR